MEHSVHPIPVTGFIVQTPKSNTTTRGDCVEIVHSLCLIDICQGVSREALLCLLTTVRI